MTIHQYLMQALEEDARRAGERDRLLLEARRTRRAHGERPGPASRPVRRRRRRFPAPIAVGIVLVLAVTTALIFIGLQASAQASADSNGRLEATFTDSAVSVTPGLGMVELILRQAATPRYFTTIAREDSDDYRRLRP